MKKNLQSENFERNLNFEIKNYEGKPNHSIFDRFEPVICRTLADIQQCLRIRYAVYCVEKGWESAEAFEDEQELDPFDQKAVHILLRDVESGTAIGTARVIYGDPTAEHGGLPSFGWSQEFAARAGKFLPLDRTVEISRFTVRPPSDGLVDGRRVAPVGSAFPALGLIRGTLRATAYDGTTTVCLTVTPSLRRLLQRVGLRFHDVGVRVVHRGTRVPMFRDISAMLADVHRVSPGIWRYLADDGETWPLDPAAIDREDAISPI